MPSTLRNESAGLHVETPSSFAPQLQGEEPCAQTTREPGQLSSRTEKGHRGGTCERRAPYGLPLPNLPSQSPPTHQYEQRQQQRIWELHTRLSASARRAGEACCMV